MIILVYLGEWHLGVTKNWFETCLTNVIRHGARTRVTMLVAVMKSRMRGTTIQVSRRVRAEFHLSGDFSLPFSAAILKPNFDLCFS